MTQAQAHTNWSRTPSATQLWLGTMLHALAMLVSAVVAIVRMRPSRRAHECDMMLMPAALPGQAHDPTETEEAAKSSHTPRCAIDDDSGLESTTTIFDMSSDDDDFAVAVDDDSICARTEDDDFCSSAASMTICVAPQSDPA